MRSAAERVRAFRAACLLAAGLVACSRSPQVELDAIFATVTAMSAGVPSSPDPTATAAPPTAEPATAEPPTPEPPTAPPPPPTDIPTPEPTRDPWPLPLDAPGRSKLGLHIVLNDDARIMEFVRRVKPRVVKGVDNLDYLAEVKQISPQTITIGRFTIEANRSILDDKDPSQYPDPAQFARDYIAGHLAQYQANPWVDYWEGWNEFPPHGAAQWNWYTRFEAERACQMQALGLKAGVGGFSAGTPEYADMALFLPAIQAVKACGGVFTLHEYNSPVMNASVGIGIPGAPARLGALAGPLTLRYRYWYEGYLKPRGLVVPLVISEAGIDGQVGAGCGEGIQKGWYECARFWHDGLGLTRGAWEEYRDQIVWYDQELQKDDYVLGATLFTAGASLSADWATYNLNDMLVPIAAHMATQR